jgi:hypothetical protein
MKIEKTFEFDDMTKDIINLRMVKALIISLYKEDKISAKEEIKMLNHIDKMIKNKINKKEG